MKDSLMLHRLSRPMSQPQEQKISAILHLLKSLSLGSNKKVWVEVCEAVQGQGGSLHMFFWHGGEVGVMRGTRGVPIWCDMILEDGHALKEGLLSDERYDPKWSDSKKLEWMREIASAKDGMFLKSVILQCIADDDDESDIVREYAVYHAANSRRFLKFLGV